MPNLTLNCNTEPTDSLTAHDPENTCDWVTMVIRDGTTNDGVYTEALVDLSLEDAEVLGQFLLDVVAKKKGEVNEQNLSN